MPEPRPLHPEERFLVLAPSGRNAVLTCTVLAEAGIAGEICPDVETLCRRIAAGAAAAIVTEEALNPPAIALLTETLRDQPRWSDFPLIAVTSGGASTEASWNLMRTLDRVGNVTVVERPLRIATLVSAAQVALRSRRRQYETRDYLVEREMARDELMRHRDRLEAEVRERTAELEDSHQKLRLSERMASLGTLSAGLGHDMGNLLLPIRVRLDSLEARDLPADVREDLAAIRTSAEYLRRLSDGLRLLALDPDDLNAGERKPLGQWWASVEPLLKAVLPRGTVLRCGLHDDATVLSVPTHLLTQALFNLVQNAGDALRTIGVGGGGAVTIGLAPAGPGFACLRIADNGPGMSETVRQRCLEPFFTTKTRGFSTGLGLTLVHSIVSRAGGSVSVTSSVGSGTEFALTLPLAPAEQRSRSLARVAARVDLKDPRLRSMVEAIMGAYGLQDGVEPDEARILVTDARSTPTDQLRRFLGLGADRQVVLLDEAGELRAERLVALGPHPGSAVLRRALEHAAAASGALGGGVTS